MGWAERSTEVGLGTQYREGRAELTALLEAHRLGWADLRDLPVPACPGWTVGDTLAHVVGVCADALAGRLAGVASQPWTAAQVDERRGRTIGDLLAEWEAVAAPLEEAADAQSRPALHQWLFDAVTHEVDLRAVLGRQVRADSRRLRLAARWVTDTWRAQATARGFPPLRLTLDGVAWDGEREAATALTLDPFEAVRALSGRRSPDQLRALRWDGDPEPFLPSFTYGPFAPRSDPLVELSPEVP